MPGFLAATAVVKGLLCCLGGRIPVGGLQPRFNLKPSPNLAPAWSRQVPKSKNKKKDGAISVQRNPKSVEVD